MTGRALVFSQPEVVARLKNDFVPFAGDKWYLNRQQDADGEFVRRLGTQVPSNRRPADGTAPQGIYVAAADGSLLAWDHFHPDLSRFQSLLKRGEEKARQTGVTTSVSVGREGAADTRFARRPPAGGLVLSVYSRIPLPAPEGKTWTPNMATGRDHLWLTEAEWKAMLPAEWKTGFRYPVPAAVAERIVRYHMVDNVRGEPLFWAAEDVKDAALALRVEDPATGRLALEGSVRMQADARGYEAHLQGHLTVDRSRSRFTGVDLLSWGEAWGEGRYTRGAPPGRFPLLIAASLAGDSGADLVPPQASRDLSEYLGTGRGSR